MNSRRDFLRTATVALSAAGLSTLPQVLGAFGRPAARRLSIGETFVCPEWMSALSTATARVRHDADLAFLQAWQAVRPSTLAPSSREDDELALITLPAPGVEPFDLGRARSLARRTNDALAETVAASHGRVAGLATVAAIDPLAAREAERSISRLGLAGLNLGANRGLRLDHRSLWPIYEFAAASRAPVYLPAAYAPVAGDAPYRALGRAGVIAGASADAGRHATELIFGGVFDAFPTLSVVMGRMGEGTPYWYGRILETYAAVQDAGGALPQRSAPEYFADNMLLTTADMSSDTVEFCSAVLGDRRVVSSLTDSTRAACTDQPDMRAKRQRLTQVDVSRVLPRA